MTDNLSAASFIKDKYWFFKGEKCWSKKHGNEYEVMYEGYIEDQFMDAPHEFDTVATTDNKYWFFKGDECWSKEYGGSHKVEYKGNTVGKFPFYIPVQNPESWMQDSLDVIGDKYLSEICIPRTHNSGMSLSKDTTLFANENNTKYQSISVLKQLNNGVRYFDIRPIIKNGEHYTGHYSNVKEINKYTIGFIDSWQGARGESLEHIINGINNFTASNKELIILSLSHAYNTDAKYRDFNPKEWERLIDELNDSINFLFVTEKDLINEVTIKEYISDSAAVVIMIPDNIKTSTADIYNHKRIPTKGKYSDTDDLNKMTKDQIKKLIDYKPSKGNLFMSCWTLTQKSAFDVINPSTSIKNLAKKANDKMHKLMGTITKENFPNIISVDYFKGKALSIAIYANSLKK